MTNASDILRNPQAGSDTAPLRAKWGWIVALGVVYLLAGFVALGSVVVAPGEPGVPVICWATASCGSDRHRRMLVDDRKLAILVTAPSTNGRFRIALHSVEVEEHRKAPSSRYYAFTADE